MTFDGALQVPCAVTLVSALLQQEFPARVSNTKQELSLSSLQHALLHVFQLDFQDLLELVLLQRMKHHNLCRGGS